LKRVRNEDVDWSCGAAQGNYTLQASAVEAPAVCAVSRPDGGWRPAARGPGRPGGPLHGPTAVATGGEGSCGPPAIGALRCAAAAAAASPAKSAARCGDELGPKPGPARPPLLRERYH